MMKKRIVVLSSLHSRGWVEKFYRGNALPSVHGKKSEKKTSKSDDDDDDNEDDLGDDDLGRNYLNL